MDIPEAATRGGKRESQELVAETGDYVNCIWNAVSCWLMAGTYFCAWWWPGKFGGAAWVQLGILPLVLEMLLLCCGAITNDYVLKRKQAGRLHEIILVTGIYTVFALVVSLFADNRWLFISFVLLVAGRIWSAFRGMNAMDLAISLRRISLGGRWFAGLTVVVFIFNMPRGGLSDEVLAQIWPYRDVGPQSWTLNPHKPMAMGAIYFTVLGLIELFPPRSWVRPRKWRKPVA